MSVARRHARTRLLAIVGLTAVAAIVLVPGVQADADDSLTWAPTSITVSYGEWWSATLKSTTPGYCIAGCGVHVTYTGTKSGGFTTSMDSDPNPPYGGVTSIYASQPVPPLGAGTYELTATVGTSSSGLPPTTTSTPLTLKISPAVLSTNLLIQADPQNSRNAVISASLAGPYIDEISNGDDFWKIPAGTWHIVVKDAGGATAFTKDVATATGLVSFVNVYWSNVPAGGTFAGSATFAPTGAAAANFAITPAASATFTTPSAPTATPTAGPTDAPAPGDLTGAPIPLWLLLLLAVLGLTAAALVIVAVIRRPRTVGAHAAAEPSPHADPDPEEEAPEP